MATVTHTFLLPDGTADKGLTVVIDAYGAPWARTTGTTSAARIIATTNGTTGAFSQNLLEGVYRMRWRSGPVHTWNELFIGVPTGSLSFTVDALALSSPDSVTFQSAQFATFSTVAGVLASDANLWEQAQATNYNAGDGIFTVWVKSSDQSILPNGTDILSTTGGIIIIRVFVREPGTGVVVPGGGLSSYTVNVPVTVPTVADLQASLFSAPLVWVGDETNPMAFARGNTNADNDGVNGVMNAAGIHYDRIRFA